MELIDREVYRREMEKSIELMQRAGDSQNDIACGMRRALRLLDMQDVVEAAELVIKQADPLLANGVIVPPCKIGDTVYFPTETDGECEACVDVGTVFAIGIDERHTMWISVRYESGLKYYHTSDDFGKTVFLTREEAEQALKGGGKE